METTQHAKLKYKTCQTTTAISNCLNTEGHSKKLNVLYPQKNIVFSHSPKKFVANGAQNLTPEATICDPICEKGVKVTTVLGSQGVFVTSCPPAWNRKEAEKSAIDLASFTRSAKCIFWQRHYHYCYHFQSFEYVCLDIIRLKSSHDLEP